MQHFDFEEAFLDRLTEALAYAASFGESISDEQVKAYRDQAFKEEIFIDVHDIQFQTFSPTLTPSLLGATTYINNSDVSDTETFTNTKSTTETHTVSLAKTISFGVSVSLRIGS